MPARVDPVQRRQQIVEAAFRLVVAEGIEGASLRKVADEAGLNVGSVRHYFDGHTELLLAAAEEAGDRMGRRLEAHPAEELRGLRGEAALEALQDLVEAVMPVDLQRHNEAVVVVELILASRTKPVFRSVSQRMADDLAEVLEGALISLGVPSADTSAAQLAAVIGGLTLDTVTPHGGLSVGRLRTVLRAHLELLLRSERAGLRGR